MNFILNLSDSLFITFSENPFFIPIPVPTAVPPRAKTDNSLNADSALFIDSSI